MRTVWHHSNRLSATYHPKGIASAADVEAKDVEANVNRVHETRGRTYAVKGTFDDETTPSTLTFLRLL